MIKPVFHVKPAHLIACLVGIMLWALMLSPAWASGDDITQSNDMNNQTGGDINIAGDNSDSLGIGFAHALGDVDINDCLASTQWGTIIVSKQKVVPNMWCMGEVYDAKGMFDLAAKARCSVPEIRAWFDSDFACETANKWSGFVTIDPPASTGDVPEPAADCCDEDEETRDVHEQEIALALARTESLEQRLNDEAAARRRAVAAGQAAREAKRRDDYEFAQQQMEQFAQIVEEPPTGTEK